MRRHTLLCLLLAGITMILYWPATHFDLIYFDDPVFVTETPEINSGLNWHSVVFAFTHLLAANWHPVTNLTFLLTHQLAGPNPGLEHGVNALIHAANAALLFLLLFRLTKAPWRSVIVAAVFAWHPLRVESVAWIAERKDVLSLFIFLLTLLAYVRYAEHFSEQKPGAKKFFNLSMLLFALGLMSKSMLVSTPFVLMLLDIWPLGRLDWGAVGGRAKSVWVGLGKLAAEKWAFFALTILFSVLTYLSQRHGAAVSFERIDLSTRLENMVCSYLRYLGKTFWPQDLALLYPFPYTADSYLAFWPAWQLVSAVLVLVFISILCWRWRRSHPYLLVGWGWYLGTLLPVIGLIQVGGQGMADRYTYLPLIGPVIAMVWLVADWMKRPGQKMILIPLTVVMLAGCLWSTRQQLKYWRDTVSLFNHTIDVTGNNSLAELILGDGLDQAGFSRAALVHYRVAAALTPDSAESFQEIARVLVKRGDWEGAAENFRMVLTLNPNEMSAYLGLAQILAQEGRTAEEIDVLKKGVLVAPDSVELLNNLAWVLATTGDPRLRDGAAAVRLAEQACELTRRQEVLILGTLGAAYAESGNFNDAVAAATAARNLADKKGDKLLREKNEDLLELYQKGRAYHEPEKLVPGEK